MRSRTTAAGASASSNAAGLAVNHGAGPGDGDGDWDWQDSTVVFVNSTCFDQALFQVVEKIASALPSGARVVTLTHQLRSPSFKVVAQGDLLMSWGSATVFYHDHVKK